MNRSSFSGCSVCDLHLWKHRIFELERVLEIIWPNCLILSRWNEIQSGLIVYTVTQLVSVMAATQHSSSDPWFSILSAAPCTARWLQLSTVRKLLTQSPQIIRCQASFVFVTTAHVQTRGIRVYWSRKVPKMFIPTASSLNRVGEEGTHSDSTYSSYAKCFASLGLRFFTCNMMILTMMTLGPDLGWLCIGIFYSC